MVPWCSSRRYKGLKVHGCSRVAQRIRSCRMKEDNPVQVQAYTENAQKLKPRLCYSVLEKSVLCGPFFSHPVLAVIRNDEDGNLYHWNARHHRKMRFLALAEGEPEPGGETAKGHCSVQFLSWEPHIVSWWISWVGFVANTLWVINGVFATWPGIVAEDQALQISYGTGVLGAFMFIVTGYLGVVEVLNQTHTEMAFPSDDLKRDYRRSTRVYGKNRSPLAHDNHGLDGDDRQYLIRSDGYPIVYHHETGNIITRDDPLVNKEGIVGTEIDVVIGNHVIRSKVSSCEALRPSLHVDEYEIHSPYIWWSWNPDWGYVSVFGAYLFFVSTLVFFIPAAMWYPYDINTAPRVGVEIFFLDLLQVIPSVGFVVVGHIGMAEASGSWCWATKSQSIGYYVAFFNALGGWGFLFCGLFAIPATASAGCCYQLTKWASSFSTMWGSCFFFIAGVLQCIEFANRHPISFWGKKKEYLGC